MSLSKLWKNFNILSYFLPILSIHKSSNLLPAKRVTIRKILRKELNMKSYKKRKTFTLYGLDYPRRLNFANWALSDGIDLVDHFICSDEACFYLHGGHNIQNDRIWAEFQPNELVQAPLNDEKLMVWCAFSSRKVYGPYFFEENVNSSNYLEMLKLFFWPKHYRICDSKTYYFQQDGAPPHREKRVQKWLKDKFGDRFLD